MASTSEYEQQQFWDKEISYIYPGHGIEYQIQNSKPHIYNPGTLTEQDIIDFIKALENGKQ